jgi:hypothetical protein
MHEQPQHQHLATSWQQGWMTPQIVGIGPCVGCRDVFAFDPDTVPSIPIDPQTGLPPDLGGDPARAVRRPICPGCLELANIEPRRRGLRAWPVNPP